MAKFNVEALSLKDLLALEAKLKIAIDKARAEAKSEVKARMAELAQEHGFSVSDLFGVRGKPKTVGVAKYANPANRAQTWTGKGRPPFWMIEHLKRGKKADDCAI